jgi:hypothetical protein
MTRYTIAIFLCATLALPAAAAEVSAEPAARSTTFAPT